MRAGSGGFSIPAGFTEQPSRGEIFSRDYHKIIIITRHNVIRTDQNHIFEMIPWTFPN